MSSKKHECSACGKCFQTQSDLRRHVNALHIKALLETCPVCGQNFSEKYMVKNHMVLKHAFHKDFKCELCNRNFLSSVGLKRHKYTCDKNMCSECNKSFKNSYQL